MIQKECPRCKKLKSVDDFVTIYGYRSKKGKYCSKCHDQMEKETVTTFLEGRDFCLYCGKKIDKMYEWEPTGKSILTYVNLDHMDPRSLGGKDNRSNTVYCCTACNRKKGNKTFVDWLNLLEPKYQKLSREVYIYKHKRVPEKFKKNSGYSGIEIIFSIQ